MRTFFLSLAVIMSTTLTAQNSNFWSSINERAIVLTAENDRGVIPDQYQTFALNLEGMKSYLQTAPMQRTADAVNRPLILDLPMPDGELLQFNIYESPVMMPGIAARYPQIKSFAGYSTADKSVSVRFLYSTHGFRAFLFTPTARYYIQPYAEGIHDTYIVFDKKNEPIPNDLDLTCGVSNSDAFLNVNSLLEGLEIDNGQPNQANSRSTTSEIVEIIEYKIAVAGVAEWVINQGGTVPDGMSSVNIVVNLLNSVLGPEAAINFVLVDNNDLLIYTDPATDPYTNISNAGGLLNQNQINLDNTIGSSNYDIGHVMTLGCLGVGGVAGGGACSSNTKGRGVTCNGGNLQNAILRITVHEIAHQFAAGHTFDNCPGSLDQRHGFSAFEPGSGSTILSYSGACGSQNIPSSAIYYHAGSLQQMFTFSRVGEGSTCPVLVPTDNNTPDLEIPLENGFYIPISTPFELTAVASDPDGDDLTYCWEQYNNNLVQIAELGFPILTSPSFRSYPPVVSPTRVFPRMQMVVNNGSENVEVLPTYTRNLKFRCTARDNNPEIGGVVWEEVSFEATDQAGPFLVTYPNNSIQWEVGDYTEVAWDVANTDGNLVNCKNVNIKLSTDGGYNYPITLAENVPNTGSHFVVVPDQVSSSVRVRVEAADNIFFDISNSNFEIVPPSQPGYALGVSPYSQQVCIPDPAVVNLDMMSLLGYDSLVSFTINGLPNGAVPLFSSNPALPSEGSVLLTIETDNLTEDGGIYEIEIMATAPNADTSYRTTFVNFVKSDFFTFAPIEPTNGAAGVSELPTFTWSGTTDADSYNIEIATNPVFGDSIVETASGIVATFYTPSTTLEKSTLYYWRISATNVCETKEFEQIQAFHTELFACLDYQSVNVPINISNAGTPTIESTITVPVDGIINDINVTQVKGNHDKVNHLDVSLISPDNTEVVLFGGVCITTSIFNAGFDDEAPTGIVCPPIGVYQPEESLSNFDGENTEGTWTLKISVNNTAGAGGKLDDWALQLCANVSPSAPFLVTNDSMPVQPGQYRLLTNEFLLSQDDNNPPENLTYTLITVPQNGAIFFLGNELGVGEIFRQSSINAGNVRYAHDGGPSEFDNFTFAVTNGEGGWFGTPQFNIRMDEDVMVGTSNFEAINEVFIFPNPANDILNIRFKNPVAEKVNITISNVQGQIVNNLIFQNVNQPLQLSTANISNGIYFVQIRTGDHVFTEKVIIQK